MSVYFIRIDCGKKEPSHGPKLDLQHNLKRHLRKLQYGKSCNARSHGPSCHLAVGLNYYTRRTQIKDKLVATNHEGKSEDLVTSSLSQELSVTNPPEDATTQLASLPAMPLYQE